MLYVRKYHSFALTILIGLIHYSSFFGSEGHVALDRNPGPGYDTMLLRMIPGDLFSACPHRQFHTLPGLFRQSGCTVRLLP